MWISEPGSDDLDSHRRNGPEPSFDRTRSGGLRVMKWSLYEGGSRTPLHRALAGVVPAGLVIEGTAVNSVDFMPTLCA